MSTNYALFVEMPLKLSIPKMAVAHWSNMCYSDCMESHSDLNVSILRQNPFYNRVFKLLQGVKYKMYKS